MNNDEFKQKFYERLYKYALRIVLFVDKLNNDRVCRILGDQLLRSGTSIVANITEAKAASSKRDYINFYNHALKSANETILWLNLLNDSNKGNGEYISELLKETKELANILGASLITMRNKRKI